MLRKDGVVAVTFFEKHDDSLFQRFHDVLDTIVPGAVCLGSFLFQCLRRVRSRRCVHLFPSGRTSHHCS